MQVEKIDKIINRTIKKLEFGQRFKENNLLTAWDDVVGGQIAKHTQPIGIKRKKLFIQVDNSAWVYQLTMHHKTAILDKLNEDAGERIIKDIYFKVGKIDKN